MAIKTVAIDCGHTLSGSNTGSSGCGFKEQDLTREVGSRVMSLLKKEGITVINCTVDKASSNNASLQARCNKANAQKTDLFVSIHFNACVNDEKGNGKTTGTEVFVYSFSDTVTNPMAKRICTNFANCGYKNRGVKDGSKLYVIRNTNAPAMLVECCFIDDRDDMNLYNADRFAKNIVEGILGRSIQDEIPSPQQTGEVFYRAVAGSYTVRANAEAQQAKLAEKGYKDSFLDAFDKDGKTFLRVIVASNKNRAETERVISNLKKDGFDADLMIYKK